MVKFLLQAGADQEHKTDEMHTALMEASMDGHVDVAKLLLDSGAQVRCSTMLYLTRVKLYKLEAVRLPKMIMNIISYISSQSRISFYNVMIVLR